MLLHHFFPRLWLHCSQIHMRSYMQVRFKKNQYNRTFLVWMQESLPSHLPIDSENAFCISGVAYCLWHGLFKIYWLERNAEEHSLILIHHQPSATPIHVVWENLPKLKGEDGKSRRELLHQGNFQFLAHDQKNDIIWKNAEAEERFQPSLQLKFAYISEDKAVNSSFCQLLPPGSLSNLITKFQVRYISRLQSSNSICSYIYKLSQALAAKELFTNEYKYNLFFPDNWLQHPMLFNMRSV